MEKKTRWVKNIVTGNIKHWNPNIIGVENQVECTQDGVPLELANHIDKYKAEVERKLRAEFLGETDSESIMPDVEEITAEEEEEMQEEEDEAKLEFELNVQKLMLLDKAHLIALAKQKTIKTTGKDEIKNKTWWAERIVKFDQDMNR